MYVESQYSVRKPITFLYTWFRKHRQPNQFKIYSLFKSTRKKTFLHIAMSISHYRSIDMFRKMVVAMAAPPGIFIWMCNLGGLSDEVPIGSGGSPENLWVRPDKSTLQTLFTDIDLRVKTRAKFESVGLIDTPILDQSVSQWGTKRLCWGLSTKPMPTAEQ